MRRSIVYTRSNRLVDIGRIEKLFSGCCTCIKMGETLGLLSSRFFNFNKIDFTQIFTMTFESGRYVEYRSEWRSVKIHLL